MARKPAMTENTAAGTANTSNTMSSIAAREGPCDTSLTIQITNDRKTTPAAAATWEALGNPPPPPPRGRRGPM